MLRERILNQNFTGDSDAFEMWADIPETDLPSFEELGAFTFDTINTLKDYSLARANTKNRFSNYREKLRNNSYKNVEVELLLCCISQDAAIFSGIHALDKLSKQYPSFAESGDNFSSYVLITNVALKLEESVNKSLVLRDTNSKPYHFEIGYRK